MDQRDFWPLSNELLDLIELDIPTRQRLNGLFDAAIMDFCQKREAGFVATIIERQNQMSATIELLEQAVERLHPELRQAQVLEESKP